MEQINGADADKAIRCKNRKVYIEI